jgi:hypothetical protein
MRVVREKGEPWLKDPDDELEVDDGLVGCVSFRGSMSTGPADGETAGAALDNGAVGMAPTLVAGRAFGGTLIGWVEAAEGGVASVVGVGEAPLPAPLAGVGGGVMLVGAVVSWRAGRSAIHLLLKIGQQLVQTEW